MHWRGSGLCNRNVPFDWARGISEFSNRNFCRMKSALGAGIINWVTVLPPVCNKRVYVEPSKRRKASRTCLVPWRLYVDRSRRMKRDKRDWREHEGSEGPWEWGKQNCHPITSRALKAGALWLRDESGLRTNSPASSGSVAFTLFSHSGKIKPLLINFKNCETYWICTKIKEFIYRRLCRVCWN